jgi:hypothetical protein
MNDSEYFARKEMFRDQEIVYRSVRAHRIMYCPFCEYRQPASAALLIVITA